MAEITFLVVTYEYVISPLSFYHKSFQFENSNLYDTKDGLIMGTPGFSYLYPSEELLFHITFTEKYPLNVTITPTFEIFVGGKNFSNSERLNDINLDYHGDSKSLDHTFFVRSDGLNQVQIDLQIKKRDGVALEHRTESVFLEVESISNQLQRQLNEYTIIGIVSSIIVTSGFSGYQIMKIREEKNQTIRAWVGDTGSHIILMRYFNESGEIKTNEEWGKMSDNERADFNFSRTEHAIMIKNFGQVPATNLSG